MSIDSIKLVMPVAGFESFLEYINIPAACKLNKPVYKKMLLDSGVLDAADKTALKDDVEKIRWLYTLKPSTINIASYQDTEREYSEIAVLHVELANIKRQKRLANIFNKAIPYPLVLFFTSMDEEIEKLTISLTDKRINLVDKEKWVFGHSLHTSWIGLSKSNAQQEQIDFVA